MSPFSPTPPGPSLKCSCEVRFGAPGFKHEMDEAEKPDVFPPCSFFFFQTETSPQKRHHAHLPTQMRRERGRERKKKRRSGGI